MKSNDLGRFSDRELLAEMRLFNNPTNLAPTEYALTAGQADDLKDDLDAFETELDDYDATLTAEDAALNAKKLRRKKIIAAARQQFKLARNAPGMDDKKLGGVNLDIYDDEPTKSPAPSSVPTGHIDYGKGRHTIHFRDTATPDSEAKPDGMKGCDIYRFIGDEPPASEKEYDYLTNDSATPYVAFYDGAEAGKNAFYIMRWVSKSGEAGEWSQVLKATINA